MWGTHGKGSTYAGDANNWKKNGKYLHRALYELLVIEGLFPNVSFR
jgi:hypothetical protein